MDTRLHNDCDMMFCPACQADRAAARIVLADMTRHTDTTIIPAARLLSDYGETQKERDRAAAVLALMEDGV